MPLGEELESLWNYPLKRVAMILPYVSEKKSFRYNMTILT